MTLFESKAIIPVIHLPPLLPYPESPGLKKIIEKAKKDLAIAEASGADAVILENEYDHPHTIFISKIQLACFTTVAKEIVKLAKIPVGICVIRNDWEAALSIAKVSGAKFVRLDVFVDKVKIEQGIIKVDPQEILEFKKKIHAESISLFTDVHVKYAEVLDNKSLKDSIKEAEKYNSDGIIITGSLTGSAPKIEDLKLAKSVTNLPIFVGSGLDSYNAKDLLTYSDGAIVATSIKTEEYLDSKKIKQLLNRVSELE